MRGPKTCTSCIPPSRAFWRAASGATIVLRDGLIEAVGSDGDMLALKGAGTEVIDLGGQRVIPGLIDSHTHIIRQGNNFAMELRWDNVPSLADGLRMLKQQAERTPAGQWIRVVGGWSADQFAERRLPTIDEIRDELAARGIVLEDTPHGTVWHRE